ncbi:MAG TPA: tetratricopeptide repeat protein, partial [Candidatus Polarisedimenticolaceae bacterium]|nr:tetratricopeptide repeat protein [Candidatus Polarisedimenticolaceae bacterium]
MSERRRAMRAGAVVFAAAGLLVGALPARGGDADNPRGEAEARAASDRRGEAYARLMRALLMARRGAFGEAAHELDRAIELQPEAADLYVQAAALEMSMGRRADAERLASRALALEKDNLDALRTLADLAAVRALGEPPDREAQVEALRLYGELDRRNALDDDELRRVISLKLQAGDSAGAIVSAERLVAMRPGDLTATRWLAQMLIEAGRTEDALRVLLQFLDRHPEDAVLVEIVERLTRELDTWELVVKQLTGYAGWPPDAIAAQRLRGAALLRLDRDDEAAAAFEQVLAHQPGDENARYSLSRAYRGTGRLADAAKLARELLADLPDKPSVLLLLAETLDDQGDMDGAIDAYRRALAGLGADPSEGRPLRDAVRRRLAQLELRRSDVKAAVEIAGKLEQPDETEGLELRARVALAAKEWDRARELASRLQGSGEKGVAAL